MFFGLLMVVSIGVAAFGALLLSGADGEEREWIDERLEELDEHIREDGLAVVIDEHSHEFGPLWPAEEALHYFESDEVMVLILQGGKPVLGFPELAIEAGWHETVYVAEDHSIDPIRVALRARRVDLADGISIVGALPRTSLWQHALTRVTDMAALLVVLFIAGLCGCYFVSRNVLLRLSTLSSAVEGMSLGNLETRAGVTRAHDEFDQVAIDMNQMLDQIRRLMRNLEEVSVGAAHDLKTPLTRLDQRLQSILLEVHDPDEIQAHVAAARDHVQTLLTTFNALLRLGEIESGKLRTHFTRHSLSELVTDVAETFEAVFADQGRQLEISILPNIEVVGDRDLIAQQVSNLLENILEHTPASTNAWIRLQAHTLGALLQVGDEGPGIPMAEQDKVFERFYRVDKSRTKPGNGLGLSLVASIANVHGAQVALHERHPGCVIDITFPRP
ncbi:MAG: HAMP domain-containing sensor histidine kinase [Pseudomonadota bacterium]